MRKHLYLILLIVSGALLGMIFIFSKKKESTPPAFVERRGSVALSAEWLNTKKAIQDLLVAIETNPDDLKAKLSLSQAYIQEARITGDHAHYDKICIDLLNDVLKKEPQNFDALCCKAVVLLSQHHFSEGLQVAQQAQQVNPYNAFVYGLMCDAFVELGDYQNAVKMSDKMMSIRPDIRSYARVSYLREIHGDLPGAIVAAKLAIASGYPGLEQTAWTRMILAHLYECKGEIDSAAIQYQTALAERPDYAFALAGLGRIEKARGNYKTAIPYFEKAKSQMKEYSFADELTDIYRLLNEKAKADTSAAEVIEMLGGNAQVSEEQSGHGHYADRELAYAYLKLNDIEKANKHALTEFLRRPQNIDVNEMLGWVKYKKGETATALKLMERALRTGSKNPVLLCRYGIVLCKSSKIAEGKNQITQALQANPYLDPDLKKEALRFSAN